MKSNDEKPNHEKKPSEQPNVTKLKLKRDYSKIIAGKPFPELVRREGLQAILDHHYKQTQSKDDLFLIGHGTESDVYISEEERGSFLHILGSPGEGKSKFLFHLLRHDIDRLANEDERACGVCVIDPSAQGDLVSQILSYCAEIDFRKVLLIDPYRLRTHGKVAPINPLNYNESQIQDSVSSLMDAFRVLFDVKDPARTAILESNLPALFSILHHGKFTLHDSIYFTNYDDPRCIRHRDYIFDKVYKIPAAQKDLADIESAFKGEHRYKDFGSTVRRINTLFRSDPLDLMFSHHRGVDFIKLIENGWLILVNVSTDEGVDLLQSRLLSTIVINQVISAIERLRRNGFNRPYYLYIDEAGEYATRKIARILDLKRKIGLRFIFAHQFPGQFEDLRVKQSVENNTKLKAAFYIENAMEREKVIKLLNYGGEVMDRDVVFALASQKQRHMVWKNGKDLPRIVQVPNVPDPTGDVNKFLKKLFAQEWYYTREQIQKDNADRFKGLSEQNSKSSKPAKKTQRKTTGQASVSRRVSRGPQEDLPPDNETDRTDEKRKPLNI